MLINSYTLWHNYIPARYPYFSRDCNWRGHYHWLPDNTNETCWCADCHPYYKELQNIMTFNDGKWMFLVMAGMVESHTELLNNYYPQIECAWDEYSRMQMEPTPVYCGCDYCGSEDKRWCNKLPSMSATKPL